jgi:hypothetical protein
MIFLHTGIQAQETGLSFVWEGGYGGHYNLSDTDPDFHVTIKPYVIDTNNNYRSIPWIRDRYPRIDFSQYIVEEESQNGNITVHKFGINLTNVPNHLKNRIQYFALVVEDTRNITWSDVELNRQSKIVTLFGEIEIDYSDLYREGYTVQLYNKSTVLIGNVSGRDDLFLDPRIRKIEDEVLECLVASSDTVPSKQDKAQWTQEMFDEERSGSTKQGYIIHCKPEGWGWGSRERDPKRFIIIRIPKSEWNESWDDPEMIGNETITTRAYRFPIEKYSARNTMPSTT